MIKFYTDWDEFKNTKMCNAWVATAIIGAGVLGAGASIIGSQNAASAQRDAANTAASTAMSQYNTTRGDLAPYRDAGSAATAELNNRLPILTAPIDVTKELQNPDSTITKAYNFTKTQGLKSVQNSAAARGLGVSGAALKGASTFATGLADNTYQNLFNNANTNNTNAYNRLKGLVDTGETAAAGGGVLGANAANTAAGAQIGAGNATAAASNATGGAVSNFANNIGGYATYKGLYGGSGGYNGITSSTPSSSNSIYTGDPTVPGFVG